MPVIDAVFRPIDGIVTFVLSVVGTAVRSIADTVPASFAVILLVIDTIGGIVYGIMPSLDACTDPGRENYWCWQLLPIIPRDAR